MKKTISLVLAVLFAAIAVCTFAISAFAAPEASTTTTTRAADNDDVPGPTEPTTAAPTTAAPTTTTASGETTTGSDKTTTSAGTTATTKAADVTKTMPASQTNYVDPDEKGTKATTKKAPAKVDSSIPSTGSEILVPAVALLALAAGTVAVVKTKKDN